MEKDGHEALFLEVGRRVRKLREERGLSQRALAERAQLSLRFLADVEAGHANISIGRLADLAAALEIGLSALLPESAAPRERVIALLGLRGAGKSTIGPALAKRLGRAFVELDEEIERRAGLRLSEIFEIHGEAYYRRLERELVRELLAAPRPIVLATGGGLVSDAETWALLRAGARTIWLRARPEDHFGRVLAQGDQRPMADRPRAMTELKAILDARAPLYAQADRTIDTWERSPTEIAESLAGERG
jgi:XRE family transcriptional regulator, aerobic/anaerobic benzoate catabolism transcriptional regulator